MLYLSGGGGGCGYKSSRNLGTFMTVESEPKGNLLSRQETYMQAK